MSIELKNIAKSYDGENWTLQNINTKIETGEFFAIVGPSGCGKSTLLRMIAGLISISDGQLLIDDKDVTNLAPQDRNLTMVFQNYALFPFLSVKDNVAFGLKARKMDPKQINERVAQALELVNLTEYAQRKPRELSGGQRQRVAVARAIASDAKICLMDEPLSNLDAQLRGKMRSEIREIQQRLGLTLIYVTHDQVEAMTMADRIMVLHDHKIQQIGTPLEIYTRPANTFVGEFFGTPRMNILQADYDEVLNKLTLDADMEFAVTQKLVAGQYRIGVRPGALLLDATANITNAHVHNIEYLGNQSIIEVTLDDGQQLRMTTPESDDTLYRINQRVKVTLNGDYYVFAPDGEILMYGKGGSQNGTTNIQCELQGVAGR
ncbi:ABC transporter ATP-binding protein [Ligilactobacillus sp. Marseille-Q7487]|uniref:ABC transporter ATP-binding protein n=1 Tax=Ligilactobacillus sp. Marseille-Q7487 TaxID=3022128 RepID=UPI0024A92CA6|nr:ABC transporter ATP-binding protein [Ligilactobacillus sp. Marseille-Q7487]